MTAKMEERLLKKILGLRRTAEKLTDISRRLERKDGSVSVTLTRSGMPVFRVRKSRAAA
jgi:hypothetical protein